MADQKFIRSRANLKGQLTKFSGFIKDNWEKKNDNRLLESRYEMFKTLLNKFDGIQSAIEDSVLDSEEANAEQIREREKFESDYFSIQAQFIELMDRTQQTDPCCRSNSVTGNVPADPFQRVRLPRIELPVFDGKLTNYTSFMDVFESLIDENVALQDVDKFLYLRTSLKGEAFNLVESLPTTAQSYKQALALLRERYYNVRCIKQAHLKALFELPMAERNSVKSLRNILDIVSKNVMCLSSLGEETSYWDSILVYHISSKLDVDTRRLFENRFNNDEEPTFEQLKHFIINRCATLERLSSDNEKNKRSLPKPFAKEKCFFSDRPLNCPLCHEGHWLPDCSSFLKLDPHRRYVKAKELKMCYKCLKFQHACKTCRAPRCSKCSTDHHTLLHLERDNVKATVDNRDNPPVSLTMQSAPNRKVLLFSVQVRIKCRNGRVVVARGLVDTGSQISFVSSRLVRKLSLGTVEVCKSVEGIGGSCCGLKSYIEFDVFSVHNDYSFPLGAYVIDKITSDLPQRSSVPSGLIDFVRGFDLADTSFGVSGAIDILFSNAVFVHIVREGVREFDENLKIINTQLGWIVGGSLSDNHVVVEPARCLIASHDDSFDLKKFWELEEVPERGSEIDPVEDKFKSSFRRDYDGRFIVKLPFVSEKLGDLRYSRNFAYSRFQCLERRFNRCSRFRHDYDKFVEDYLRRGFIEKIPPNELDSTNAYYLPHHGVIKESSSTTNLRVVFSGKDTSADRQSINSLLETGPKLQNDLVRSLLRFRSHKIAFAADIEKMFCQIRVSPDHRDFLRFFYRFENETKVGTYRLISLPFGLNCSPYIAIRCLKELGKLSAVRYPEASEIIIRDSYVDDIISGSHCSAFAFELCSQLMEICSQGGFSLRKWRTNDPDLRERLGERLEGESKEFALDDSVSKVLGMMWKADDDSLSYLVNSFNGGPCTKRSILSWIARVFDPLGLLSPVLIIGKILIQRLWILKLEWDEPVPDEIESVWCRLMRDLPFLTSFSVSRYVSCSDAKIFAFCDASEKAYGCCIYFVVEGSSRLVFAKSRVSPVKVVSLARLELCAAVICSRALAYVIECFDIHPKNCFLLTDSKIVLSWIAKPSYCWKAFIANRVSEIQSIVPDCKWFHVSSSENPADIVSRGMFPAELVDKALWWTGPDNILGIIQRQVDVEAHTDAEFERRMFVGTVDESSEVTEYKNDVLSSLIDRISDLKKLKRVFAWVLRFIKRIHVGNSGTYAKLLSVDEVENAFSEILRFVQCESFGDTINCLRSKKSLKSNNPLISLNPFLDDKGILRVGGRLRHSSLTFDQKFPIILPKRGGVTAAIIWSEHLRHDHLGAVGLTNVLRQRFWIVSCRLSVRGVLRRCIRCFRCRPMRASQMMGDLPPERTEISRAFYRVGIDICGPFLVRPTKKRGNNTVKCYVALFVCLSTKAIHLETVLDLTSESFLAAFRRFCGRRGLPAMVITDNATNFVGLRNLLREWYDFLSEPRFRGDFHRHLLENRIVWQFIPPRSFNFGGLWESHIKSFKSLFARCAGEARLTFEEFDTLMIQVEASLNSRSLGVVTESPDDLDGLTPGHFLIGAALKMLPCPIAHEFSGSLSKRWMYVQELYRCFWQRWVKEYVHELQSRRKNRLQQSNISIGDVGLVVEDGQPPLRWPLGRVVEVIPGRDGLVRVLILKTERNVIKRSVNGFCRFDFASVRNGREDVRSDIAETTSGKDDAKGRAECIN